VAKKLNSPTRLYVGQVSLAKKAKSIPEFISHFNRISSHLKKAGFKAVRHNVIETEYRHPSGTRLYHDHNNGENFLYSE
jgi:hypothetical protein